MGLTARVEAFCFDFAGVEGRRRVGHRDVLASARPGCATDLSAEWAGVDRSHGGCSRVFVVGDLVLCGSQACKQLHRPAIAATGFRSSSTAPRIVAITTTTAPATHTARTSFSILPFRRPSSHPLVLNRDLCRAPSQR